MTSLATIATMVGRYAEFKTSDGLTMIVKVTDAKFAYGNVRYVITDTNGTTITVDASRVKAVQE